MIFVLLFKLQLARYRKISWILQVDGMSFPIPIYVPRCSRYVTFQSSESFAHHF